MKKSLIFFIVVLVVLTGFMFMKLIIQNSIEKAFYSRIPIEIEEIGLQSLDAFIQQDFDAVAGLFVDELNKQEIYPSYIKITEMLEESGEYINHKFIGYYVNYSTVKNQTQSVSMEFEFSNKIIIYQYEVTNIDGKYKLLNNQLYEISVSLNEQNKFTFADKGILHYIVFLATIMMFLFSIITASIAFGKMQKRALLWSLISLCGVGAFSFAWTTGGWDISLLSIGFPVTLSRTGIHTSLILIMRFPIGAILYWFIKHRTAKNKNMLHISQ